MSNKDNVAQESVIHRWLPELAAVAAVSLAVMGYFAPGRITTIWLAVLGLIGIAYAAKVRTDVGY